MFHTLPPTQTRPAQQRSQVAFGKSGKAALNGENAFLAARDQKLYPGQLTEDMLNDNGIQKSLRGAMPKYQYTIADDFFVNYQKKLTFHRAQNQIKHLHNNVTGGDLERFHNKELLGLVEESSDMFFEMFTLKALNKKLITKEQVEEWTKELIPTVPEGAGSDYEETSGDLVNGTRFNEKFQAIRTDIADAAKEGRKKGQLNSFRNMVNQGWAEDQYRKDPALDVLALIGMKFALMSRKDPNYSKDLWDANSKLLYGEGEELREEMAGEGKNDNHKKWLITALSHIYTHPALLPLPGSWFRKPILSIVQGELGKDFNIDYKDLMETVFSKQIGRQELDFSRPDIDHKLKGDPQINKNSESMRLGNAKRKCVLKPYELWQESAVLKNAMQGDHKKKDIQGEVLNTGA